jgi:hypothetical protein
MSKKHFEMIAAKFAATQPYCPRGADADALTMGELAKRQGQHQQWQNDVVCIADFCAAVNSAFNRTRFYAACGVEDAR